jgi:WYL domain
MHPQRIDGLSHNQRERMAYIDFRLYFFGEIGRPDLCARFGLAPAGATRDFALYREIGPQNIQFDGSSKIYRIGRDFAPLFEHASQRVLSALALGFGDGVNGELQPLLPCESPTALGHPKIEVLAPICRAIYLKCPLSIRYHSMSSGMTKRVVIPFALVDTGLRWHVRAFDRKSGEFRDFVITRVEAPVILDEKSKANETAENDIQWTRIVEMKFVPHPRLSRPEIVRMDYGMINGSISMRVRAAAAGYMLLRWGVDASPNHCLKDEQYRLWLSDPLALYGVENAKLAPGYQAPNTKTRHSSSPP